MRNYRGSLYCLREYICHHKHNVGRNINIKGHSGKVLDENEVIKNCRKGDPCYKMAKLLPNEHREKKVKLSFSLPAPEVQHHSPGNRDSCLYEQALV